MSKTIKIIELLNKIANGEEPPEKITIAGHRYKYNKETKDYDSDIGFDNKDLFLHIGILKELNIPIIIEEQEGIDKLEIDDNGFIHTNNGTWKGRKLDIAFAEAINKLAEEVKNIKEK